MKLCLSTEHNQSDQTVKDGITEHQSSLAPMAATDKELSATRLYLESEHISSMNHAYSLLDHKQQEENQGWTPRKREKLPKGSQTRETVIQRKMKTFKRKGDNTSTEEELRKKAEERFEETNAKKAERRRLLRKLWKEDPKLAKEVNLSKLGISPAKGYWSNDNFVKVRAKSLLNKGKAKSPEEAERMAFQVLEDRRIAKHKKRKSLHEMWKEQYKTRNLAQSDATPFPQNKI